MLLLIQSFGMAEIPGRPEGKEWRSEKSCIQLKRFQPESFNLKIKHMPGGPVWGRWVVAIEKRLIELIELFKKLVKSLDRALNLVSPEVLAGLAFRWSNLPFDP